MERFETGDILRRRPAAVPLAVQRIITLHHPHPEERECVVFESRRILVAFVAIR